MNRPCRVQSVIEGQHFDTVKAVHGAAVVKGFTGCMTCTADRLQRGATTWAELLAPLLDVSTRNATHMAQVNAERKEAEAIEMAEMCAVLDARKAAIKAAA